MVAKEQPRDQTSPRHKDSPQLYGGYPEVDKEEEEKLMAAMCHSNETYSVMQPNRVEEVCSQQLNQ